MEHLPTILPVFKMHSTILMPHAQLPLSMSEEDYLSTAMEISRDSIVGIVQPKPSNDDRSAKDEPFELYKTGCAGKVLGVCISSGEVTVDIRGICRFEVVTELPPNGGGLDRAAVSYDKYQIDIEEKNETLDQTRLMQALETYFKNLEVSPNWNEIEKTPTDYLVSALAMACPLHPSEKQALLETIDLKERSEMITKFIEMDAHTQQITSHIIN